MAIPYAKMLERAQLSANEQGKRVALINLNPAGQSNWCLRTWDDRYAGDKTVVPVDPATSTPAQTK